MKTEPTICNPVLVHPTAVVLTPQKKEVSTASAERRKELSLKRKALFAKIPKGCTEILTGKLWLGSGRDARQKNKLLGLGITHIINCAVEWKNHYPSSFVYYNGNIFDNENQDLSVFFSEAFDFLDELFKVPTNKVFIHCVVGKSRSATLTIAYLMRVERLTLKQAFAHVWACRPIICPNDGFMRQLMDLEKQIFNTKDSSLIFGEWKPQTKLPFDSPVTPDSPSPLPPISAINPYELLETQIEQDNFHAETTTRSRTPTPTPLSQLSPELLADGATDIQHAPLDAYVQVRITPELLQNGLRKLLHRDYEPESVEILQWAQPVVSSCSAEGVLRRGGLSWMDVAHSLDENAKPWAHQQEPLNISNDNILT